MLPSDTSQKVRFTSGVKEEPFLIGTARTTLDTNNRKGNNPG
jgi:hypothetical protein